MSHIRYCAPCLLGVAIASMAWFSFAHAATQFFDDFSGDSVDASVWTFPTGDPSFYGRTQIRPGYPPVSNGMVHLQLDTYNPTGYSFYGSEISTRTPATHGPGLIVEVRARLANPVQGLVGGAFLYNYLSADNHSEIDFELLSNKLTQPQTNIYANEGLGAGDPAFTSPDFDITQFNNYRIEWWPDRVRWFINNQLVRENTDNVPHDAMALHLNFYAPSCDWIVACDPSLLPANDPGSNRTYFMDVDWVLEAFDVSQEAHCLFDWAENAYGDYFAPANSSTLVWSEYTYRYYSDTNTYLGVSSADDNVYYMLQDGVLQDAGPLSYWLTQSSCEIP